MISLLHAGAPPNLAVCPNPNGGGHLSRTALLEGHARKFDLTFAEEARQKKRDSRQGKPRSYRRHRGQHAGLSLKWYVTKGTSLSAAKPIGRLVIKTLEWLRYGFDEVDEKELEVEVPTPGGVEFKLAPSRAPPIRVPHPPPPPAGAVQAPQHPSAT